MPDHPQIDAPVTLTGLFPLDSDDEDNTEEGANDQHNEATYEIQPVDLVDTTILIRQFDFHSHNANRIWPGTFNLAEFLLAKGENGTFSHQWGDVLELGTATGLLAIRLAMVSTVYSKRGTDNQCCCSTLVTSDVDDERNEVAENLIYNFSLNGYSLDKQTPPPPHVPHTWGTGWEKSVAAVAGNGNFKARIPRRFDTIVASDILLYVSAYPSLVKTLSELMPPLHQTGSEAPQQFIMSWNRRMKESASFFSLMEEGGFTWKHEGRCIYTFSRDQ